MQPRVLAACTIAGFALTLVACGGPVTEEDLQLWTRNDKGFQRLGQVVSDPQQPLATRVRALEVVVEKGFPMKVRGYLDEIGDRDDRKKVVDALEEELLLHLEKGSEHAATAKDALVLMQRYMTPAEFEPLQQKIAAWAFKGVDWKSDADAVKEVGNRISSGQIMDLGKYGFEAAGVLISHGFLVDNMLDFLTRQHKDGEVEPKAAAAMIRGIKLLHKRIGAQGHHIEALVKTPTPESVAYLLDMYLDQEMDTDIRLSAFNAADELLKKEQIKKNPDSLIPKLMLLMGSKDAEDRWLGAMHVVRLTGAAHLDKLLAAFKDDKAYNKGETPAARQVMDFCLDIYDLGFADKAVPIFAKHLGDSNRIVRAISLVCLKGNRAVGQRRKVQAVVDKYEGRRAPEDVDLDDFLGEKLTEGKLATNVVEGLGLIAQTRKDAAAGKLNKTEQKHRELIIIFELAKTGEEYTKLVEERYAAWHVQYEKDPSAFEPKKKGDDKKKGDADGKGDAAAKKDATKG